MADEEGRLEDLSQDVHLFGNVRLTQIHWLILGALAGFALAAVPAPSALRLVLLAAPLAATVVFLQLDGPVWARRYLAYLRRPRETAGLWAPHADALARAATPLCDLGAGFAAAAEIDPQPFRLAERVERERRASAWAALFNAAAAQSVQVDVFTSHGPVSDVHALPGPDALEPGVPPGLRGVARERLRLWIREAAASGYETRIVVRLVTGARDAGQAWQRFQACRAAFLGAGGGLAWEWVAGSFLWSWSLEWADPGATTRRMVWEGQRRLGAAQVDVAGAAEGAV